MIRTLAAAAALSITAAAHAQPSLTSISLDPTAISADGHVVVGKRSSGAAAYWTREAGVVSILVPPGTSYATITGVSGDGAVLVGTASTGPASTMSWLWVQGNDAVQTITVPGFVNVQASCLSRDGLTVGGFAIDHDTGFYRAFVWTSGGGGRPLPLGGDYASTVRVLSPDGSHAAGRSYSGLGNWPMVWSSTDAPGLRLGPVTGQVGGTPFAMTPDTGLVVGDLETDAFVWSAAQGLVLLPPSSEYSGMHMRAITEEGHLAAGYEYAPPRTGYDAGCWPMLWRRDTGLLHGNAYFASHGVQIPFDCRAIVGVSSDGRVFAASQGPSSSYAPGYVLVLDAAPCGSADFNNDGDSGTDADIEAFFACLAGNCCPRCDSADFNGDGDSASDLDIEAFFRVLAGGSC